MQFSKKEIHTLILILHDLVSTQIMPKKYRKEAAESARNELVKFKESLVDRVCLPVLSPDDRRKCVQDFLAAAPKPSRNRPSNVNGKSS